MKTKIYIAYMVLKASKINKLKPFPTIQDSGSSNMELNIFHNQILSRNIFKFKFSINEFYC